MPRKRVLTARAATADQRRAEISRLVLENLPQRQIAEKLGVSRQAVSKQIGRLVGEWRQRADTDVTLWLLKAITKLEGIDAALRDEWFSQEPGARDPRLQVARLAASERLCRLLKLEAEPIIRIAPIDRWAPVLGALTDDELRQMENDARAREGLPPRPPDRPFRDAPTIGGPPRPSPLDDDDTSAADVMAQ